MPKGRREEKRPTDVIGAAVKVMKIATGEIPEYIDPETVKSAAAELGGVGKHGPPISARNGGRKLPARQQRARGQVSATNEPLIQAKPHSSMAMKALQLRRMHRHQGKIIGTPDRQHVTRGIAATCRFGCTCGGSPDLRMAFKEV